MKFGKIISNPPYSILGRKDGKLLAEIYKEVSDTQVILATTSFCSKYFGSIELAQYPGVKSVTCISPGNIEVEHLDFLEPVKLRNFEDAYVDIQVYGAGRALTESDEFNIQKAKRRIRFIESDSELLATSANSKCKIGDRVGKYAVKMTKRQYENVMKHIEQIIQDTKLYCHSNVKVYYRIRKEFLED